MRQRNVVETPARLAIPSSSSPKPPAFCKSGIIMSDFFRFQQPAKSMSRVAVPLQHKWAYWLIRKAGFVGFHIFGRNGFFQSSRFQWLNCRCPLARGHIAQRPCISASINASALPPAAPPQSGYTSAVFTRGYDQILSSYLLGSSLSSMSYFTAFEACTPPAIAPGIGAGLHYPFIAVNSGITQYCNFYPGTCLPAVDKRVIPGLSLPSHKPVSIAPSTAMNMPVEPLRKLDLRI